MNRFFTSDLSIDEALLVEEVGFEPVELVFGSAYFHAGVQWGQWSENMELAELTQSLHGARAMGMGQLLSRASEVGADGILGVRLEISQHGHHVHFLAAGTAVRRKDGRGGEYRVGGQPFTSDLSGQDFLSLSAAGYRPRGLVMGNCVYHIAHRGVAAWIGTTGQNVELETFTQALYDAREAAMMRLQAEATHVGATGVVGMRVHEGSYAWESHVIEFFALGTAVAPLPEGATLPTISPIVSVGSRA